MGGRRMTTAQLRRWASTVDWSATYRCRRCGHVGPGHYVQPQPDGQGALCTDCINAINAEIRARRRAWLDAQPRCAVPGCKRRATIWHPNRHGTGLCRRHWRRAEANLLRATGAVPLFGVIVADREALIRAATS